MKKTDRCIFAVHWKDTAHFPEEARQPAPKHQQQFAGSTGCPVVWIAGGNQAIRLMHRARPNNSRLFGYNDDRKTAFSLLTETTGSAGGGTPQKSFRFKHRVKRTANIHPYDERKLPLEWGFARLRAVGQVMQVK
jgi:hypothetical protein